MHNSNKLKICFVTPYSPKIVGGVGTFILELCNYIEKKGFDYVIIAPRVKNELDIGKNLIELEIGEIKFISGFLYIIKTAIHLIKMRKNISIVHIQTPNYLNFSPLIIGKILGIHVITTLHGKFLRSYNPAKKNFSLFVEKLLFLYSNEITYVSNDTKKYYMNRSGNVILNGVNTNNFFRNNILRENKRLFLKLNNDFVILYVGRWVAHKGIYDLIDAFSEVSQNFAETKLILVGSGEKEEVLRKIMNLNLSDRVFLFENVENVSDYYCISDLFILYTSQQEGLPIALLEAMACELPVITTNVGGIPEVIVNNDNGFLINENDKFYLKEKILWCIEHKKEIIDIGKNARRTVIEKFDIEKMAEKYIDLYLRLT